MSELFGKSLIGTRVGDYLVQDLVGQGGMSMVFRARDERLGRQVALKVLAPQLALDTRFRQRFVRESRTVAGIDHPNIIPIFEAGEADGLLFIAMRYVEGRDLRGLLDHEGPPPVARANRLLSQVASALDSAHQQGLVHRDVKPANILIAGGAGTGEPEHVYLTDFGLTKSTYSLAGLTSQGQFLGTPRYVAPEQITGQPVDGRSDLYALGCVAYEVLTGVPPFQRDSELALLYAHVSDDPAPVTSHRPDLPPSVDLVMARALAKSPVERYGTCREFVAALRDAISGEDFTGLAAYRPAGHPVDTRPPLGSSTHPSHPRAPSAPAPRPAARIRLTRGRLAGVAFAVLAVIALGVAFLTLRGGGGNVWKKYPSTVAAPFTFSYPGGWEARTHADLFAVASPAAEEFERLFTTPIAGDWTSVNGLISQEPARAQGVYTGVSDSLNLSDSSENLQESLKSLMPGEVGYAGAPVPVTVGGHPAFRIDGVVSDPKAGGRLDFFAYVVQRPGAPAAFLTFFCAPASCDRPLFDRMISGAVIGQ
ncbi:serine/threonine-protein kinase [Bailinhaonella thermotolerans]|uniref:non-specific serine/threonine protein kinase n=1 Tax=Bailinhaonella thermotolerans TaxID=1070861 RepID=A0A3A3ZZB7_9ACTN|nr:serine/threonine-protein kinase [Bailinhaonella thermotolerans]RJL20534.1 serine/threonine protein kinase [Bailinhaonella thermotolerans]